MIPFDFSRIDFSIITSNTETWVSKLLAPKFGCDIKSAFFNLVSIICIRSPILNHRQVRSYYWQFHGSCRRLVYRNIQKRASTVVVVSAFLFNLEFLIYQFWLTAFLITLYVCVLRMCTVCTSMYEYVYEYVCVSVSTEFLALESE